MWCAITIGFALFAQACTSIRPLAELPQAALPADHFDHSELDRVLRRYVDDSGRVDYRGLARNPHNLERYFSRCARFSPDSHPHLFPTRDHALAYWINAYNAAVLTAVVRHYPIGSVGDVGLSLMKSGFFVFQRFPFGGASVDLYRLENRIVRDRFRDPRIHFALNCASAGCPRLPRTVFSAHRLDAQLDRETRRFFAELRNVFVDHDRRTVHLSAILDWYESDFTDWPVAGLSQPRSTLDYISHYAGTALRADLARARDYELRFHSYDWSLNDQAPSRARD